MKKLCLFFYRCVHFATRHIGAWDLQLEKKITGIFSDFLTQTDLEGFPDEEN